MFIKKEINKSNNFSREEGVKKSIESYGVSVGELKQALIDKRQTQKDLFIDRLYPEDIEKYLISIGENS